jgi:ribonucleoside-diphosphate reductase alpha chain
MAVLRVDHPDIEEFITCKTDENAITNFNISVGITDAFMEAVRRDDLWDLRFPDVSDPAYKGFRGTLDQAEAAGLSIKVYKTVRARDLFDQIVSQAHHNGEPGMLFLDAANRSNPVPHLYQLEATNPCFIGSTRIATDHGLVPIQVLADQETSFLAAADERAPYAGQGLPDASRKGIAFRPASLAWKTRQNAPVFRLETRHGYSVTATADHKFLTPDRGYVEMGQLKPGDRLLLQSGEGAWSKEARLPNVEHVEHKMAILGLAGDHRTGALVTRQDFADLYANLPVEWSHELGLVMGSLVGDGWLSPRSNSPLGIVFHKGENQLMEAVHSAMQAWFGPGHLHERASIMQLTYGRLPYEFFASLGLLAVPAHEKRVPESIWSAPRPAVVGFLQGLFTTDGTVNWSEAKKSCSLRLASASRNLLEDVQLLLINFGIVSKIHHRLYAAHADYELLIDKGNRDLFLEAIGFIDEAKQARARQFIQGKARRTNRETFDDTIRSIEPAGTADVYDLTEPQTHSVVANGILAHQCGEQYLGPNENCCLGSVNLAQHFGPDGTVDWEKLRQSVTLSTTFLDDVVDANAYVPAVPQLKEAAHRARRIGLGIMGLADLMYHAGIRYGSEEGQEFGAQVMEFVRYHAMQTSIALAEKRGPFPALQGSLYDSQAFQWQPPVPLAPYTRDFGRPALDWDLIAQGIRQHGIRNAAQTTVAPTGTIATVAGCEGYGCEPVFALAYIRHVNDNGKDLRLAYASPQFEAALVNAGLDGDTRQALVEHVMELGTCQGLPEVPAQVAHTFVVSQDITAEEHVRMQAALQAFVDNSLSKTINFPEDAAETDVATAYMLAWELGCKGITVYVTGSRQKVVLETNATARSKQPLPAPIPESPVPAPQSPVTAPQQLDLWHESKKPRPRSLMGYTYNVTTPLGKAFITINENGGNQPFEVFINTAKAGSDTAAVSEAIGRLISYILRLASPVLPRERLKEVWRQLSGIGGPRSLGFGPNRVRSLPDGVSQVLAEYLESSNRPSHSTDADGPDYEVENENGRDQENPGEIGPPPTFGASLADQPLLKIGDLCPECGQAAVVNEEGCRKCYACGYSEC